MKNPNGPYPGRQVFLGRTGKGEPCFAYLVTGRSAPSRERRAFLKDNMMIVGPLDNVLYDPLRHYTAVKYENDMGLAVFTNGIQTNAIFEMYRLLYHTTSTPDISFLKKIMEGANYEPDSLKTPRVSGVIANPPGTGAPVYQLAIITSQTAAVWQVKPENGKLWTISTYRGDIENPLAFDVNRGPAVIGFTALSPEDLASFVYGLGEATYKGDDIRVCSLAGIWAGNAWQVALVNRHKG